MRIRLRKILVSVLVPAVLAALMAPTAAFAAVGSCQAKIPVKIQTIGDSVSSAVTYKLVLESVDGAPMPEHAELDLSSGTGSGTVVEGAFGPITYTAPEDYQYRIRQASQTVNNFTYDATVYDVTVRITVSEAGMEATVLVAKDGSEAKTGEIAFTNDYDRPGGGSSSSGGGGGGGGSTPTVVPDGLTEIADTPTPQSAWPELVEIANELVPMGLPQTGDTTMLALWATLAALSGGGLILLLVIRRREYE